MKKPSCFKTFTQIIQQLVGESRRLIIFKPKSLSAPLVFFLYRTESYEYLAGFTFNSASATPRLARWLLWLQSRSTYCWQSSLPLQHGQRDTGCKAREV